MTSQKISLSHCLVPNWMSHWPLDNGTAFKPDFYYQKE